MKLARAAVFCLAAACSSKPDAGTSLASASASAAPAAPPHEVAMFPARTSLLRQLPALALVPKDAQAVTFVRSIEALERKMGATDARVREAIYAELDDESLSFSKDLGEVSAWQKLGVARDRPIGHVIFDERARMRAVMLPIADEAAWKAFLETRKSDRVLREDGAVTVLGARKNVTRAVVVRDGYAIVLREGESYDPADGTGLGELADRIAALPAGESLGASTQLAAEIERNAFGELASGYVRATQLFANKQAQLRAERDRLPRERDKATKIEADLTAREGSLRAAIQELGDAFVVFGVDLVGDRLLAKGSLSFGAARPFAFGPAKALPPTFAALRTSSLEGWGNVAPSLAEHLLSTRNTGNLLLLRFGREIVTEADLTGDVAFLREGGVAFGLRDPAAVEKKIAALPDPWKRSDGGVVSTLGLFYRVADGFLVAARDEAFVKAFPQPVAGAAAPPPSGALAGLLEIDGTTALFRVRPLERDLFAFADSGLLAGMDASDDPCGPFALLGALGKADAEQTQAREKACKKLGEIDKAIGERKRAARTELEKAVGTIEIVAKPRDGGADLFAVLSTETPDFTTLMKRALAGVADGAPTAEEAKARKALKAEVTAIDEEASKRFGESLGGLTDGALFGDNRVDMGVMDGFGAMGGLNDVAPGAPGAGRGTLNGSTSGGALSGARNAGKRDDKK